MVGFEVTPTTPCSTRRARSPSLTNRRERKSIQTLCPRAESWVRGVSGMEPPTRGAEWFRGSPQRMASRHPLVGYPRGGGDNDRCSAGASGELAQPGGDRLLVPPCLPPARGARLAGAHGVRARQRRRDLAGSGPRDESPGTL